MSDSTTSEGLRPHSLYYWLIARKRKETIMKHYHISISVKTYNNRINPWETFHYYIQAFNYDIATELIKSHNLPQFKGYQTCVCVHSI